MIKASKYLLFDDGVVFVFEAEDGILPEISGEHPLTLDFIEEGFCLTCGPYCMPLTDEIVSHLNALAEKGGVDGNSNLVANIVGARTGFMEYRIEPVFDFPMAWSAVTRLVGLYDVGKEKAEEIVEKGSRH